MEAEGNSQSLLHTCQCQDASCCLPSCQKMKKIVQHTKVCMRKIKGGCPICKQLMALCCYHAKHCQETKCSVPFCLDIKYKLKTQQLHLRLQKAHLLRLQKAHQLSLQMAVMSRTAPTGNAPSDTSIVQTSGGGVQVLVPGGVSSFNPLATSDQTSENQPDGAPINAPGNLARKEAVQQLLQTLQLPQSVEKHRQILSILKANPPLMSEFIKQRQAHLLRQRVADMCRTVPTSNPLSGTNIVQTSGGETHVLVPGADGPFHPLATSSQMGQLQLQGNQPGGAPINDPENLVLNQALQSVLQTLPSSPSGVRPEIQQHILSILKANPELMVDFIKHRQQGQLMQQAGNGTSHQQLQSMLTEQFQHLVLE